MPPAFKVAQIPCSEFFFSLAEGQNGSLIQLIMKTDNIRSIMSVFSNANARVLFC